MRQVSRFGVSRYGVSGRSGRSGGRGLGAAAAALALACALLPPPADGLHAAVIISELMYNAPLGRDYEYVEVHNTDGAAVDIGGWSFTGITYAFPAGTLIGGGAYIAVCASKDTFRAAYPAVPEALLFGDFAGTLDNGGEEVQLLDASSAVVQDFTYDDDAPWEFLADGFGSSLERLCFTLTPNLIENWRASPLPATEAEFGGSPAAANTASLCPPELPPRPRVLLSEIMYHPVLENDFEDHHEFLEIHNAEAVAVDLSGWSVAGVRFTFPPGSVLGAGGRLVLAKNAAALAAEYPEAASAIGGEYEGSLDNGGEKIAIIGAGGQGIDSTSYDDEEPWPVGADALGAGDRWLRPELLPESAHQYRGHSLERVSFDWPAGRVENWAPSPLDAPTPGAATTLARETPLPIVLSVDDVPAVDDGDPLIRPNDEVLIRAAFSPPGLVGEVRLEHFVDDVAATGEAVTSVAMRDDGAGGDAVAGDDEFTVILSGRAVNSIVRYRILADRGGSGGLEPVYPRPTDPNSWRAYLAAPIINTTTAVYHVFISPANWGTMWTNVDQGRANGCTLYDTWDEQVPAVFCHEDRVFDASVRYQGSRWNRTNGGTISTWPYPRPTSHPTGNIPALSWRIALPRYAPLDGKRVLTLNKLTQGCPGINAMVGYQLFGMADVPYSETRYARFYVNGGYYRYMIELERPGEESIVRYHEEQSLKLGIPREEAGHLYKSAGFTGDEGPWGWGDARLLPARCTWNEHDRYFYTYDRKTYEWETHDVFMAMLQDLHAARGSGAIDAADIPVIREFFEESFDIERLAAYIAIINWSVPFDDYFQNHFIYQRRSDGKWLMTPWDLDLNFGGGFNGQRNLGSSSSIYFGEQGDLDNRSGWWNYIKDSFIKAFRDEYRDRLAELNNTVLHPDTINALLDDAVAQFNQAEATSAASAFSCNFAGAVSNMRSWAQRRFDYVNSQVSAVSVDAGLDQTVFAGTVVQFDARASRPDPGPEADYTWSNGMTGDFPALLYTVPGEHIVTLTVTANAQAFQDSVTITVLDLPDEAFVETGGEVTMEAEHFHANARHGAATAWWEADTAVAGYAGEAYMEAKQTAYTKYSSGYASTAPELRYMILFENPGTYRVWVRGLSAHSDYDSVHVGLDGAARDESFATRFVVAPGFLWSGDSRSQGTQQVTVTSPGVHFLSLWIRESGQIVDKIFLSQQGTVPLGPGPEESGVERLGAENAFVRGDVNQDRRIEVSDGFGILVFYFLQGDTVACEDHADVDDSGLLEVTDALALFNYLFLAADPPDAPFLTRGLDPTPDIYPCGEAMGGGG
jgi:hypothetical protein